MNRINRSSINMFASLIGYIVPMLVQVIALPLLLKMLGKSAFGLQSLVSVVIGYFSIMEMGLTWPIMKYLAEDHALHNIKSENSLLNTTLQLYLAIGIVGMAAIILFAEQLSRSIFKIPDDLMNSSIQVFRLAGIGFLGTVMLSWGQSVGLGLQRFDITYGISIATNLICVFLGLIAVYTGYGVIGYVFMRVMIPLFSVVVYIIVIRHLLPTFHLSFGIDRVVLRRVRNFVGYGAANRVLGSVIGQLDKTLIGAWIGIAAVGVYSVPSMIVSSLGNMVASLVGFIFPMTSELQSLGEMDRLRTIFIRSTRFITTVAGMIFVPLLILGTSILKLWVPSIAEEATVVLRLLIIAGYLQTISVSLINNVVIGLGHIRQFTIYSCARGLVLVILCFVLIRPLGVEGAGWALLLTVIIDLVFLIIASHNYFQLPFWTLFKSAYLKPIALSVVLSIPALLICPLATSWIGLGVIISGLSILYVLLGWWIGLFGETEKGIIIDFMIKMKQKLAKS